MKLPGTLDQLWRKLASSPVPVTSISIPTEHGPVVLTFASPAGDKPESSNCIGSGCNKPAVPPEAVCADHLRKLVAGTKTPAAKTGDLKPPAKKLSDTAGAFLTPPAYRQDPFAREDA